jgi:hypothetical protein
MGLGNLILVPSIPNPGECFSMIEAVLGNTAETHFRHLKASAAANLLVRYGRDGKVASARRVYKSELVGLEDTDDPALWALKARGISNLIGYLGRHGNLSAARRMYHHDLSGLVAKHPERRELREIQSWGLDNLKVFGGI